MDVLLRAAKSLIALSRETNGHAVTRCAINGSLGRQAGLVTVLSEARPTTSPTHVACMSREGMLGLCQQEGG